MESIDASRLRELLVRDEIRGVLSRLARGTDRCDAALIRSCYQDDAHDDHGGYQGDADGFAKWACETLRSHFAATMHFLGSSEIRVEADVAFSETYCTAHHVSAQDPDGSARDSVMGLRYLDRFESRQGGPWLIAKRVCVYDWTYIIASDERWPLVPPFVTGTQAGDDPSYALLEAREGNPMPSRS